MRKRLLTGLAIWMILGGCWVALGEPPLRASQDVTKRAISAVPDTPRAAPGIRLDPPVVLEMRARQHHARINMILYRGRLGVRTVATTGRQLEVIAVGVGRE